MNKIFTFSSLLLSGVLLGSLFGKISGIEVLKLKKTTGSKNAKDVNNYINKNEEDDFDQFFI